MTTQSRITKVAAWLAAALMATFSAAFADDDADFAEACDAQVRYQFEDRLASAPAEEADRMVSGLCACLADGLRAKGADLAADASVMRAIARERPFHRPEGPTPEMIALLERQAPVARPCMAAARP